MRPTLSTTGSAGQQNTNLRFLSDLGSKNREAMEVDLVKLSSIGARENLQEFSMIFPWKCDEMWNQSIVKQFMLKGGYDPWDPCDRLYPPHIFA